MSNALRKPTLTPELAALSLAVPTPQQTGMDIGGKANFYAGMFMTVAVNEIDFFDKNPRTYHDPELYGQIKESIRETGIQQPVHITRRPGGSRFVLAQGGNTRLRIMQELLAETGEERYAVIPSIYVDYTSEADIQIAHLIENEQRAEMCFWDKAQAYAAIRDMFQAEQDKKLSTRELEALFLTHGLSLSYKILGLLLFAKDTLEALGALSIQLSNPKTIELRKLYNQLADESAQSDFSADFPTFWNQSLSEWAAEHADTNELDVPALSKWLKQVFINRFFGGVAPVKEAVDAQHNSATGAASLPSADTGNTATAFVAESAPANRSHTSNIPTTTGTEPLPVEPALVQPHTGIAASVLPGSATATADMPTGSRDDVLKQLHILVRRMLASVHLDNLFRTSPLFPYGFYIEYPDFGTIPASAEVTFIIDSLHPQAGNVFAWLAKVSGQDAMLNNPELGAETPFIRLPETSRLRMAYQNEEMLDDYQTLGIGDRSYCLADRLLEWLTTDQPLYAPVTAILAALRTLNQLEAGHE